MWWTDEEWAELVDPEVCGMCADDRSFDPRKINYLVMGHRAPHLHCHVFLQHLADDPLQNVDISDGPVHLPDSDMTQSVGALREAWHASA